MLSGQSPASSVGGQSTESTENVEFKQLSVDVLDGLYRKILTRIITRTLSTNIAEITYA
jgi:hypothetical protein